MNIRLLTLGLLCLPLFLNAQSISDSAEAYLSKLHELDKFSGSVLVAKGDEVLYTGGFGHASIEFDVPNTPETRFRLGSITKQFTAVSILQLVEQGKIDLDGVITDYLPAYPAEPHGSKVTVHQLLNHTSGIPSYTGIEEIMSARGNWSETPRAFTKYFEELELEFEPGSEYKYNNSAYHLLGLIIEAVSEMPYEDYLRKNILDPLGMENTGVEDYQEVILNEANGYARIGAEPLADANINMNIPYAAGSMYSTVGDLHIWHEALTARKLLSEDSYEKMFTPYLNNYGYGWAIVEWFEKPFIQHGGGIDGFSTFAGRFPEEKVYVIVLANLETSRSANIARDLAAMVFGEPYEMPKELVEVEVDPAVYEDYLGTYQLFPDFSLTILREGDQLFAQGTGQQPIEIFPASETLFFAEVIDAKIEFVRGEDGKVDKLILHQGGQVEGKRVE